MSERFYRGLCGFITGVLVVFFAAVLFSIASAQDFGPNLRVWSCVQAGPYAEEALNRGEYRWVIHEDIENNFTVADMTLPDEETHVVYKYVQQIAHALVYVNDGRIVYLPQEDISLPGDIWNVPLDFLVGGNIERVGDLSCLHEGERS